MNKESNTREESENMPKDAKRQNVVEMFNEDGLRFISALQAAWLFMSFIRHFYSEDSFITSVPFEFWKT